MIRSAFLTVAAMPVVRALLLHDRTAQSHGTKDTCCRLCLTACNIRPYDELDPRSEEASCALA